MNFTYSTQINKHVSLFNKENSLKFFITFLLFYLTKINIAVQQSFFLVPAPLNWSPKSKWLNNLYSRAPKKLREKNEQKSQKKCISVLTPALYTYTTLFQVGDNKPS